MLLITLRCGNRLKDWKTMPTSRRTASMFRTSFVSFTPSTVMSPRRCSSSRFMVRMKVDLPEPDGPSMTTFSPLRTDVVIPLSTWKSPNHLWTSRQMIMSSDGAPLSLATGPSSIPIRVRGGYRRPTPRCPSIRLLTYDMV